MTINNAGNIAEVHNEQVVAINKYIAKQKQAEKQIHKFKIVRETSPYNKYIKWFCRQYTEDGSPISSFGYKTEREARESVTNSERYFPVGDRLVEIIYQEIK
jgi:hypothetical protein